MLHTKIDLEEIAYNECCTDRNEHKRLEVTEKDL